MGFKKRLKKKYNKYKDKVIGIASKVNPVIGALTGGKESSSDGDDTRGQAAAQLMKKNVNRQAGSGQVNFTEETYQ